MTTKEFMKIYTAKNGVVKYFDFVYDFFSNDLPEDFCDKLDVEEVILDTKEHNETAKNFDCVLKFTELIQRKHPGLYKKLFQYFDAFLIDYHSFHNNREEAEKSFSNFCDNPDQVFDYFLNSLNKLLYYQHYDLVNRTVTNSYEVIKHSEKLIEGAESDLAILKFYFNLEYFFNTRSNKTLDKIKFEESILPFDFYLKGNTFAYITKGLINSDLESKTLIDEFTKNRHNALLTIQSQFLVYMKAKDFGFALSGRIWDKMLEYWEVQANNGKHKPDTYFFVKTEYFERHLSELTGNLFYSNTSEMIAVLWGSVYIYDFLVSIGLINQATYNGFKTTSNTLKGKVIAIFTTKLWNSNFVHQWKKPDGISDIEFIEEAKIFQKSLSIKKNDFEKNKKEIKDELKNIGELLDVILRDTKEEKINHQEIANDFFNISTSDFYSNTEPIKAQPKIGRNEPCICGSGKKYKKCCGN
ncbi:MAG: SEC-C metal-binding domain-containing protein [Paludibacter sp.]|nr:SEC-C metal-binding domain-containing protein [Paludibacter sp.]